MRRKLTEIISTMDQYNGIGKYSDEYEGGEQVDINTDISETPTIATITKGQESMIIEMLTPTSPDDKRNEQGYFANGYVLTFDKFLSEQKGKPSNVASYMGCLDDADDLDEEE